MVNHPQLVIIQVARKSSTETISIVDIGEHSAFTHLIDTTFADSGVVNNLMRPHTSSRQNRPYLYLVLGLLEQATPV